MSSCKFWPLIQNCRVTFSDSLVVYWSLCWFFHVQQGPKYSKVQDPSSLFPLSDEAFYYQTYASTRSVCFLLPHMLCFQHLTLSPLWFVPCFPPSSSTWSGGWTLACPLSCHVFIHQQPTPKYTWGRATHCKDKPLWKKIISGKKSNPC